MFKKPDLILLHAPALYDFRTHPTLLGPISDVIPSTPIFEMYPIGFSSIAEHLENNNIRVRIINLAFRMLENPKFEVEKFIAKLKPAAFGIDLHWLVHAQGSLEIAKICKKYHPDIPVIFGGYSSTYFHDQLLEYPQVDYVLKGDSTEEPLLQLIKSIKKKKDCISIPNLSWRDTHGKIQSNPITNVPDSLNTLTNNYQNLFKLAVKNLDPRGMTAIRDWWKYPITAVMNCRGCTQNCIICGGSKYSMKHYCARTNTAYRDPELIVNDVKQISRFTNGPIFIIGDLNQPGEEYADIVLKGLKQLHLKNELVVEIFNPADEEFYDKLADAVPNFNIEFSPESHDQAVRKKSGKFYTNEEIELNIKWALERGCNKFDIFFMIGLPLQTQDSVRETVQYSDYLLSKFGKKLIPFISPLSPFLDPGSIAFENPEKFGYKLFYKKLEDFRTALLKPSWKYFLSYETEWLTREQIVESTYEAGEELSRIKYEHGLIDFQTYESICTKIKLAKELIERIDEICPDIDKQVTIDYTGQLNSLKLMMERDSISSICEKEELKWPIWKSQFKIMNIIKAILFE
ncbi:B12-binding domain/radical SAM domain protein [candidate division KSB1 bacterium 4572_119]|nr:MAG: B12-binding domain/radical SAM domain protein [candidate division KSB1 bacterium 4572_119]